MNNCVEVHDKSDDSTSSKSSLNDPYRLWTPLCYSAPDKSDTYNWKDYLDENINTAPVSNFRHVPFNSVFSQITEGLKVEVPNRDYWETASLIGGSFWMASVVKIAGYKLLLRYEGLLNDSSEDFWMNIGSSDLHHIGWCAKEAKPLVPPKCLSDKPNQPFSAASDWKAFLVKRLTGSKTLPINFQERVVQNILIKLRLGHIVEAMDRNLPGRCRLAQVVDLHGQRVCVQYLRCSKDWLSAARGKIKSSFKNLWCHVDSSLIKPYGWSYKIGGDLYADDEDLQKYEQKVKTCRYDANDATEECFPKFQQSHIDDDVTHSPRCKRLRSQNLALSFKFELGMKLEAIDIYNNYYTIAPTTVTRVFDRWNCIQITYDGSNDSLIVDNMSPYIFPIGYCQAYGIDIAKPEGYVKDFDWPVYLKETNSVGAPALLFKQSLDNTFVANQKIEATDNVEPNLLCVATITEVRGRLVRVHYDGWTDEYDQWFDASSPEVYPVGYCELTGHCLESPNGGQNSNLNVSVDGIGSPCDEANHKKIVYKKLRQSTTYRRAKK